MGEANSPPWFVRAIETPYREHRIAVHGSDIHYLEWGEPGRPGLVFVHGGAAHAHWWSFIAPMFTTRWHAVALDLSGHGGSGWRENYSHTLWSEEVLAVAGHAGFPGPPVVVGHSLGGGITLELASTYGDRLAGGVIVDTPVRRPDPESREGATGRTFRSPGTYPDETTALRHFRLVPSQPCENEFIVEHIGRLSLRETESGWTWRFDPHLFDQALIPLLDQLLSVDCRVAFFRGEFSTIVPEDTAAYMYELTGRATPFVSIPEAHHHLILDQPLAFVAALRTLLADWEHSIPRSPL